MSFPLRRGELSSVRRRSPSTDLAAFHFGNEESIAFNYGRLLKTHKIFGLYAELPVAIYPRMDLNYHQNMIPKDIGALFVTPSVRLNIFSGDSVTPWVSAGGGYGRFREAPTLIWGGPNPGPTGTNTGVVQFGAGLDVWVLASRGVRGSKRAISTPEFPTTECRYREKPSAQLLRRRSASSTASRQV